MIFRKRIEDEVGHEDHLHLVTDGGKVFGDYVIEDAILIPWGLVKEAKLTQSKHPPLRDNAGFVPVCFAGRRTFIPVQGHKLVEVHGLPTPVLRRQTGIPVKFET
jgi:hypothetical protein